jgi:hypothetical protein
MLSRTLYTVGQAERLKLQAKTKLSFIMENVKKTQIILINK